MANLLLTVLVAAAGSYLFYKLKIPAGALIGAIIFTAVFNILTDMGSFPGIMKTVMQAIAGSFIGQRITRRDIGELRQTLAGGVIMFVFMIGYTLAVGFFINRVTSLDLPTSLVCSMPAGLSDTAIISADLGANATQTTVIHTVRTLYAILLLPQLAFQVCKKLGDHSAQEQAELAPSERIGYKPPECAHFKTASSPSCWPRVSAFLASSAGSPQAR